MKKIVISVIMMALLLLGCQKQELELERVFTASVETFHPATKTALTPDRTVVWSKNDRIAIFEGNTLASEYAIKDASVGKSEGTFVKVMSTGDVFYGGTEIPGNVLFYPYSDGLMLSRITAKDNKVAYSVSGVLLPKIQHYVAGSFSNGSFPMIAATETIEDNNVSFKNILGAMELKLSGSLAVRSVMVKGNDGEILSGSASVSTFFNDVAPTITMTSSDEASKTVILDCGQAGVQLRKSEVTKFIISLPPTSFAKGFTVTITDMAGKEHALVTEVANPVLRSSILVMPEVALGDGSEDDEPDVEIPAEGDYLDEYGINHGKGVNIGGVVWAPVNCGFHSTDYPWGKLYQYGRRYGQGYSGELWSGYYMIGSVSDATVPEIVDGGVLLSAGQAPYRKDTFFKGLPEFDYNWLSYRDDLWNSGTEEYPQKTAYDPCPNGWRVPTASELSALAENSSSRISKENDLSGFAFSGSNPYSEDVAQVYLPAAGSRNYNDTESYRRGRAGSYWSSSSYYRDVYSLNIEDGEIYGLYRAQGIAVRCVQDSEGVSTPVASVVLDKETLNLCLGQSENLSAVVSPSDARFGTVIWDSDSPNVVSVSQSGEVTALALGSATVYAFADGKFDICTVTVALPDDISQSYIDEYGINHGPGIEIDGVVWAPVNCGYHSTDYQWGKLYQFGRKYGQGYSGYLYDADWHNIRQISDAVTPECVDRAVSEIVGNHKVNENVFFTNACDPLSNDWLSPIDETLWNFGTEESPLKTEYDPCPDGWRVPTQTELDNLCKNGQWTTNTFGQNGYWFTGSRQYSPDLPKVFFPAAGSLGSDNGRATGRGNFGCYWTSSQYLTTNTFCLTFNSNSKYLANGLRGDGSSVRCVKYSGEVEKAATSVIVDESSLSLQIGESVTLNATILPSEARLWVVEWSSSDEDVVIVDQNGKVTAVFVGEATIFARVRNWVATCSVSVAPADYVDEYGVNHGRGLPLGKTVWAPVNCGYNVDYPYGKLYQWGREYGQGYSGALYDADHNYVREISDAKTPEIVWNGVSLEAGQDVANANKFFAASKHWLDPRSGQNLWNSGSEKLPEKSEYDPCPDGWRVPTHAEFNTLLAKQYAWMTDESGQNGYLFSSPDANSNNESEVFFPAAGYRDSGGGADYRGANGYYWSTYKFTNPAVVPSEYYGRCYFYMNNQKLDLDHVSPVCGMSVRCVQE